MRIPATFRLAALLAATLGLQAAVLPEGMGAWKKTGAEAAPAADAKLWPEFGFQTGEKTAFADADRNMSITAWRFSDSTGSLAAFFTLRPVDSTPTERTKYSIETKTGALIAAGNYLLQFEGLKPSDAELNYLAGVLPKYSSAALPTLLSHVPAAGRIAGSDRYILGPESLAKFTPGIPPSAAAFHFGAEAAVAKYGKPGKESTLVLFNYPLMAQAREQLGQFQQVPGAVVKRAGPIVALVLHAPTPDDAERLLSQVTYNAQVTVTEKVPTLKDNPVNLFWNIAILILVIFGFCILSGLVFGGIRLLLRRKGITGEEEQMIRLDLDAKR